MYEIPSRIGHILFSGTNRSLDSGKKLTSIASIESGTFLWLHVVYWLAVRKIIGEWRDASLVQLN